MIDIAIALGMGLVIGAASGIPLGVLNVALVEAATRTGRRHATGIGVGGALADGSHAALALAGVAPLLARYPDAHRGLLITSGAIVLGYAALVLLRRRVAASSTAALPGGSFWRGVGIGASLTLPNPAALLAWVAVAGALLPAPGAGVVVAATAGVTVGSGLWFVTLAWLAGRADRDGAFARWVPRVVAVLLVGFGLWTLWRAV